MLRQSPRPTHAFLGLAFLFSACQASAEGDTGETCEAPALSRAFSAGTNLSISASADCEDESCALAMDRPAVSSEEEGACAIEGLKQALAKSYRHGKHGKPGKHRNKPGKGDAQKQCKRDGKVVGQTAAALYCDLSILLGGLGEDELLIPGEESACSSAFEEACGRAFDRAIAEYAASVGDPSADCTVFAQGEFQVAYEIARFNQCLFSIGTEPPPPPVDDCSDGSCECRDAPTCDLDCQGGDCEVLCEHAGKCEIDTDGGDATCRHVAECTATQTGPGTLTCEHAGTCDLACQGPDCDIVCKHVGRCNARIDEGSVRCERTGKCNVECTNGKKSRRTREGVYVCDKSRHEKPCPPRRKR